MLKWRLTLIVILCAFIPSVLYAGKPETPKVDKVKPLEVDPLETLPGVYFYENLDTLVALIDNFHDVGYSEGRFSISWKDSFSGRRSIKQEYLPISQMGSDPGDAGWAWRHFGDSPLHISRIPEEQRKPYKTVVARWYHKFEPGFQPRDGLYFPPKMARMRCFGTGGWRSILYTVLFWIGGEDGHISIERHTKAPGVHREWCPNFSTKFLFSNPENVGRWIHFELRVSLGDGPRSDRIQAWADGVLICDVANDDLAAGYDFKTLNAMSWDCYWNNGSPARQSRYYDDMMLSVKPIGPVRTGLNPGILKSAFESPDDSTQGAWEAEVASGEQMQPVVESVTDGVVLSFKEPEFIFTTVWQGTVTGSSNETTVDNSAGEFTGPLAGRSELEPNTLYFVRVRQQDTQGNWSDWSGRHSGFATTWAAGTPPEQQTLPTGYLAEAEAAVLPEDDTPPVIEETLEMGNTADTTGPYTVTCRAVDENMMAVYLYYRTAQTDDYTRITMEETGGVYEAQIPGRPVGTVIQYYTRARDLRNNSVYDPPGYRSEPYSFEIVESVKKNCDFNGDGQVNIVDVVALLIAGIQNPEDTSLDYNGDGTYTITDAISMLLDIRAGSCADS